MTGEADRNPPPRFIVLVRDNNKTIDRLLVGRALSANVDGAAEVRGRGERQAQGTLGGRSGAPWDPRPGGEAPQPRL